jgi:hypothetical protein
MLPSKTDRTPMEFQGETYIRCHDIGPQQLKNVTVRCEPLQRTATERFRAPQWYPQISVSSDTDESQHDSFFESLLALPASAPARSEALAGGEGRFAVQRR